MELVWGCIRLGRGGLPCWRSPQLPQCPGQPIVCIDALCSWRRSVLRHPTFCLRARVHDRASAGNSHRTTSSPLALPCPQLEEEFVKANPEWVKELEIMVTTKASFDRGWVAVHSSRMFFWLCTAAAVAAQTDAGCAAPALRPTASHRIPACTVATCAPCLLPPRTHRG